MIFMSEIKEQKKNGFVLGLIALVIGVVAIAATFLLPPRDVGVGFFAGIAAIVLGIIALAKRSGIVMAIISFVPAALAIVIAILIVVGSL